MGVISGPLAGCPQGIPRGSAFVLAIVACASNGTHIEGTPVVPTTPTMWDTFAREDGRKCVIPSARSIPPDFGAITVEGLLVASSGRDLKE